MCCLFVFCIGFCHFEGAWWIYSSVAPLNRLKGICDFTNHSLLVKKFPESQKTHQYLKAK